METYRLNSKVVEKNKEYVINTTNDIGAGVISSSVFVDGALADTIKLPHPENIKPEEVLKLVQTTHEDKKNELESLLNAYREVCESGTKEIIFQLGLAFYYKNYYGEAQSLFEKVISLDREFSDAYFYLGRTLIHLEEYDLSLECQVKAVEIKPQYADYRNYLGESHLAAGNYNQAIAEFERAVSINLYYADAYYNHGLTLLKNGIEQKYPDLLDNFARQAIELFYKASLINAELRVPEYDMAQEALESDKFATAYEIFEKLRSRIKEINRQKAAPLYMKYVMHPNWINEDTLKARISYLQSEIKKNPTYVDLYVELSQCYLVSSKIDTDKAVKMYKKAAKLNTSMNKLSGIFKEAVNVDNQLKEIINRFNKQV